MEPLRIVSINKGYLIILSEELVMNGMNIKNFAESLREAKYSLEEDDVLKKIKDQNDYDLPERMFPCWDNFYYFHTLKEALSFIAITYKNL